MAPMAGSCPPELSAAVANAGGLGGCGVLNLAASDIKSWAGRMRALSNGSFQLNLWIPDPPAKRDPAHETKVREFLGGFGPEVPATAGDDPLQDFAEQCEAMLEVGPTIVSSIMGVYPPEFVARLRARNIAWFATATTVAEARQCVAAGADAIIAQGSEAGGHRGAFNADEAMTRQVGLFSLLPAIVDAVDVPVIAAGGVADPRGIAAALVLGASAVQIGTALLRTPEAAINPAWADAIGRTAPEDTAVTRAYSGRAARGVANAYIRAAAAPDAPTPAPYPVQRGLTAPMRAAAANAGNTDYLQAWAGQSAALSKAMPAAELVTALWEGTLARIGDR